VLEKDSPDRREKSLINKEESPEAMKKEASKFGSRGGGGGVVRQ